MGSAVLLETGSWDVPMAMMGLGCNACSVASEGVWDMQCAFKHSKATTLIHTDFYTQFKRWISMCIDSSQQNHSQHLRTLFLGWGTLDTKQCPCSKCNSPAHLMSITITEDRQAAEEHESPHSSHDLPFVPLLFFPWHKHFYTPPTKSS